MVVAALDALSACDGGVVSVNGGRQRLDASAPLANSTRERDYLAYAVPKTELYRYPATRSAEYAVRGIDVSKHQGDIDWQAVKNSGVAFAFIKATEGGDHTDPKFQRNWEGAKAAGLPRGAYHFVYWCRLPREEIGQFERVVPVEADALPPVLDVEVQPNSGCDRTLYREDVLEDMREMLEEMERRYGKKPIIYTSVDFYQAILHPDVLAEYPIWVSSTKYHPTAFYGARKWSFWQYRADGAVKGVPGAVDQNVFQGSMEQWRGWLAEQAGR